MLMLESNTNCAVAVTSQRQKWYIPLYTNHTTRLVWQIFRRHAARQAMATRTPSPKKGDALETPPPRRGGGRTKSAFLPHIKEVCAKAAHRMYVIVQVKDENHTEGGPYVEAPLTLDSSRGDGVRLPVRSRGRKRVESAHTAPSQHK